MVPKPFGPISSVHANQLGALWHVRTHLRGIGKAGYWLNVLTRYTPYALLRLMLWHHWMPEAISPLIIFQEQRVRR